MDNSVIQVFTAGVVGITEMPTGVLILAGSVLCFADPNMENYSNMLKNPSNQYYPKQKMYLTFMTVVMMFISPGIVQVLYKLFIHVSLYVKSYEIFFSLP